MNRFTVVGNALLGILAVLGVALLFGLTVLPAPLNYRTYTVLSGSMEPSIRTGSIIVATPVDPRTLAVGDVITFSLNQFPQVETITHRIVEIRGTNTSPTFVTKGDANPVPDNGEVAPQGTAGKVVLSVPLAGYFLHAVSSPRGRLAFIIIPAIGLALMWLWDIWRPRTKAEPRDPRLSPSAAPDPSPEPTSPQGVSTSRPPQAPSPDASANVPIRQ